MFHLLFHEWIPPVWIVKTGAGAGVRPQGLDSCITHQGAKHKPTAATSTPPPLNHTDLRFN